jgi:hypothetical protein
MTQRSQAKQTGAPNTETHPSPLRVEVSPEDIASLATRPSPCAFIPRAALHRSIASGRPQSASSKAGGTASVSYCSAASASSGPVPLGGVLLRRFRTKRGGHGADSSWWRHGGFAAGPKPRRVLGRLRSAIAYRDRSLTASPSPPAASPRRSRSRAATPSTRWLMPWRGATGGVPGQADQGRRPQPLPVGKGKAEDAEMRRVPGASSRCAWSWHQPSNASASSTLSDLGARTPDRPGRFHPSAATANPTTTPKESR